MEKPSFTFEQLPQAIAGLYDRLHILESLIQAKPTQPSPPETDRWLSLDELRDYLPGKPAKATIYGKVHSREIPHKKVGKRLAFLKSEIDFWLNSQSRKTASEIEAEAFVQSKKKRGVSMLQHNLTPGTSLNSGQSKDANRLNQLQTIFLYLSENVATASMVSKATGVPQKNICRYKRDLEKAGRLWEVTKGACKETGFSAYYLTTDPSKAPKRATQLKLF